jgi:murein L,D-transpeptidase YcbB/YkuD
VQLNVALSIVLLTSLPPLAQAQVPAQAPAPARAAPEVTATVAQILGAAQHLRLKWSSIGDVTRDLWPLYDAEPDRLLWFDGGRPLASVEGAVLAVSDAAAYGLDADDYDASALQVQWAAIRAGRATTVERAQFDLALSVAGARLVRAVHIGRVDPALLRWTYEGPRKAIDGAALLQDARAGRGLGEVLRYLEPQVSHYVRARATLATYRALAAEGEPPPVPALPSGQKKVVPGQAWSGVPQLVVRLQAVGDLVADVHETHTHYSGGIVDAVKRFQARHGLEADGVVGASTLRAINVPLAARVRQIALAMERMRWLPLMDDEPNIFVNVANFRLWANDPRAREEPLRMKVVVGEALDHQTPLFVERLQYIVFRPFWNPPRSILLKEILPRARKDPSYMGRNQYEIVASGADDAPALAVTPENLDLVQQGRLTLRQRPGPSNSLGLAKFIFPNDENVYMHGTPSRGGFAKARRDLSHGCVRLEDPAALASWVLRDYPGWTRARIDAAMTGDKPVRVDLDEPMTVVLFYDTVHVSRQGVVYFLEDIYGHDTVLDAALKQGYPYPASLR